MSTNPADCDRTTVYTGECRNFADTEWIRFDSGRRRSPDARDGNTWLIDVAHGSFWMSDDKVRNLVPLVPAPADRQWTRDDLPSEVLCSHMDHDSFLCDEMRDMLAEKLNALHPKPGGAAERTCDELRSLIEGQKEHVSKSIEVRNRMRRERDAAVARAEAAEREASTWRTSTESAHSDFLQAAHDRDEWKARATLAEQECENWRVTAINRAAPAVSRADIEKAILPHILYPANGTQDLIDDVHALVSGDDPAVYVVRESDLPEAYRGDRVIFNGERVRHWWTRDGDWIAHQDAKADEVRREGMRHLVKAARHEAVARAIEAEQSVDPVEGLTDNLADILYGDELVTDQMRGVLERVVRAGMLLPEQEADR